MTKSDSRSILVTGGAGGIGESISRTLANAGHPLVITYREARGRAEQLAQELNVPGRAVSAAQLDLGLPGASSDLVSSLAEQGVELGGLVHNAVAWPNQAPSQARIFHKDGPKYWDGTLATNIAGSVELFDAVVPHVVAQPGGRMVLISSNIAMDGLAGSLIYGTAKSALHGAAKSLAWDIGASDATINVVAPGLTATPRVANVPKHAVDDVVQHTPIGRLVTAEEVAAAVAFFCSAAASGITGQTLRVTGGH